ncbi:cytochrome c biogenesis CcdA family protein [Ilumatobacter sp.]|uniref:cytochrome c biogenesis CcdA family protein n=1 Tax=Ilumatobacter sp. TaxID=1967498 RepID=UPI003751CAA9
MDTGLLALALVARAVAAFNPCGFALLPAYLSVLVAGTPDESEQVRATRAAAVRAIRFAAGMTIGFVAVFGLFGAVVTPLALSIERYLPYVTVAIGVALIGLGAWLLLGHSLAIRGLAGRGTGPTQRWGSQISYGVTFAVASLSCTIAPFLAVTSTALGAASWVNAMGAFVAYGLGMGTVVLVLALAVATSSAGVAAKMRRAGPLITRSSGVLLVIAGAYVTWYGWFEIRVLSGASVDDPIISAGLEIQGQVAQWVSGLGAGPILLVAGSLGAVVSIVVVVARRRSHQNQDA